MHYTVFYLLQCSATHGQQYLVQGLGPLGHPVLLLPWESGRAKQDPKKVQPINYFNYFKGSTPIRDISQILSQP